ncbi:hypothetical protein V1517DRAFT_332170 [Lipomyces orientalis]|uniref:Uncharacterized protein n=1 Tax=Lipomyces orientalis TaxID=1233043 RepID=A0ACC3TEF0_9ASCO
MTVSSVVEQYSAPINGATFDNVVEAEADVPTAITNPANHELVATPIVNHPSPMTCTETANNQVNLVAIHADNCDMKLLHYIDEATPVMSLDGTPTAFVRAPEVATVGLNMTTLDEVPLVTNPCVGHGDMDHDDAVAALSSIVEQYAAPVDAMAVDVMSDVVVHMHSLNITDEFVSIADANGAYEVGDMTLSALFELPELGDESRCDCACANSTVPIADATVSSVVEQHSAPINEPTFDVVADAEAHVDIPDKHELVLTPETCAESTNEQVRLYAIHADYHDMKLLDHIDDWTPVMSLDGTPTGFVHVGKEVAPLGLNSSALDGVSLITNPPTGYCDNDTNDTALSSVVEQYSAHFDAKAFDAASDAAAYSSGQNIVDEPVSITEVDGIYEMRNMTLDALFMLSEMGDESGRDCATMTSTAPFADTTVSSVAKKYAASINGATFDNVLVAEAEVPSPFANQADQEPISTPILVDTAPETCTKSTDEQVHLSVSDAEYSDMKLLEHIQDSATSLDGTRIAFDVDGNNATSEHRAVDLEETSRYGECNETRDVPIPRWVDTVTDRLNPPYFPVFERDESKINIVAHSAETEGTCINSGENLSDVLLTDILYASENGATTPNEESTAPSTPTTPMGWSGASSPMSMTPTTPIEACDDTTIGDDKELLAEIFLVNNIQERSLQPPEDNRGRHCESVSDCTAPISTSPAAAVKGDSNTAITAPVTEVADKLCPAPVTKYDTLHTVFENDGKQVACLDQCSTAPDEEPRWLEYNENSDVPVPDWIDMDISFTDHLNRPYTPLGDEESKLAIHNASEGDCKQVASLDQGSTAPDEEPRWVEYNENSDVPVPDWIDMDISFTDHLNRPYTPLCDDDSKLPIYTASEGDGKQVASLDQCATAPNEEPRWVEYNENSDVPVPDWIDMGISFTDHLNLPYTPVHEQESNVLTAATPVEAQNRCVNPDEIVSATDVSLTELLHGSRFGNNSTPSADSKLSSYRTTPMTCSGASSPASLTAVRPTDGSPGLHLAGPNNGCCNVSVSGSARTADSSSTTAAARVAIAAASASASASAYAYASAAASSSSSSTKDKKNNDVIAATVTEFCNAVIPAERQSLNSPVQDVESQDPHYVAPSRFALRTLSRVKSVLASPFFSAPQTNETVLDILSSFPTSIHRELISALNNKEIFHGTCDHANPTGCGNCADKVDYLKRVRSAMIAGTCNDSNGNLNLAKAMDIVLQARIY